MGMTILDLMGMDNWRAIVGLKKKPVETKNFSKAIGLTISNRDKSKFMKISAMNRSWIEGLNQEGKMEDKWDEPYQESLQK